MRSAAEPASSRYRVRCGRSMGSYVSTVLGVSARASEAVVHATPVPSSTTLRQPRAAPRSTARLCGRVPDTSAKRSSIRVARRRARHWKRATLGGRRRRAKAARTSRFGEARRSARSGRHGSGCASTLPGGASPERAAPGNCSGLRQGSREVLLLAKFHILEQAGRWRLRPPVRENGRMHGQGIRAQLSRLLGPEHVLDAPVGSEYNRDASGRRGLAGRAEAVARPGSAEQVAALVGWCYEHDVPIVPRGGGTGLAGGAVPTEGSVVCSLERLRGVRELEPGLWRMFVEAGVTTRHVQRLARENGLFFGPDPGAADQAQIGGNVATNAGGPHALKYGVTGAWVAGLEAVLAPGELVAIGGWIRKDVAGYDLKDLLIGSEGTLGIITAVRLRLLPAPASRVTMVVFFAGREEGCAAALGLLAGGLQPSVLDFLDGDTLAIVAAAYPPSRASGAEGPRGEE